VSSYAAVRLRSVAVGVLLATAAGHVPSAAAAAPKAVDVVAQVRALDREVNRVSDELARQAAAYEVAQDRSARLTQRQFDSRDEVEERTRALAQSQASFGGLARAAYKGAVPPLVTALLSGDPGSVADLAYVQRSVERAGVERHVQLVADAQRRDVAGQELVQTDAARREALAAQESADDQLRTLLATADALTAELAATADRLVRVRAVERAAAQARLAAVREATARSEAARRAARAPAAPSAPSAPQTTSPATGGGDCQPPSPYGEANGFLSEEGLCPLAAGRGHRLRTDAARAFDALSQAYRAEFGTPLCVTDSYRSYAAQVDVFKRKPSLAATPGRSQHGWGLAVDLCGGVQTFGSPAHEWMRANGGRFGWEHPRWAQRNGSKPEPWHWEYRVG
jgi:hypothetical protein